MMEARKIRNDIVAVGLLALIVFLVAALATYDPADPVKNFSSPIIGSFYQPDQLVFPINEQVQNACGPIGAFSADLLLNVLGVGTFYLIIGLVALEVALFQKQAVASPVIRMIGWMLSLVGLTALATMLLPGGVLSPVIGAGGYLGALGAGLLAINVGFAGSIIIATCVAIAGLMMWTEYLMFRAGRLMFAPAFVAAASLLPFGLVHRFMMWFNSRGSAELSADDIGEGIFSDDEDDELRTIRFRRRDLEPETVAEDDEEAIADAEEDEDDFDDEDNDEEEEADEDDVVDESEDELPATIPLLKRGLGRRKNKLRHTPKESAVAADTSVPTKPHFKVKAQPAKPKTEREAVIEHLNAASETANTPDYELPSLELLNMGKPIPFEERKREALRQAQTLELTYKEFGYDVKVVEIETGPVISQYELQLASGLRLNKITALADDLAIALRVPSVRIVAPIPGKNTVGVEVPNESRQPVMLRSVMEQSEKQIVKMKIPLFLGKDAVGAPMVADLAALPHLLIAGRTGTGKSVCLNSIISSILMTRRPDEVRMLMIDPKMVELSGYGRLPHLMHPVVTDMRKAEAILAWAVDKMEDRYKLLAKAGVRHLTSYNQLGEEELIERLRPENDAERTAIPSHLPFIVIVADEMADLMMTAGKEVEQHIIRLAQKSRAVGIHLVMATQKPTVDVITGLIKSNLPARIAFQVASKMDSRVVLDVMGADKLLGMGDMLFLKPGTSMLLRGQGTFLSDREIDSITEQCSTGEQNFVHELVNLKIEKQDDEDGAHKNIKKRDEMYEDAVDVIVREQRGSVSLLQRTLGMGYGRAARVIDWMEEDGIVGPYSGSKAREVLMTSAQWDAVKAGGGDSDTEEIDEDPVLTPLKALTSSTKMTRMAMSTARTIDDADVENEIVQDEEEIENEYDDDECESNDEYECDDEYESDDERESADEYEEDEYDVKASAEEADEELGDEEYEEEDDEEFVDEDYDENEYEDVE